MEDEWRRLEGQAEATLFQSWDWCDCWLSHYGHGGQPLILKVVSEDKTLAIAPLLRQRSWFGLPLRRVTFIGTGPSDYGGLLALGPDDAGSPAVAAALADVKFDLVDLHQLPESPASRLGEALKDRFNVLVLPQEPTLAVELPIDLDAYLSTLSKKFRTNTVYADRRLRRDFKFEQKTYKEADELFAGMDIFFRLHQQRWLAKRLPGLFVGGRNRRFHQALAGRLAFGDRLVLSVAFLDGEPAAAFYGFKFGKSYSYYLGGFDPKLAKYSASTVLIFNLIKDALAEQAKDFDFLRGQETYKLRWGAGEKPLFRLLVFPSTPRGRLAAGLAVRQNQIVQRARAGLHK
ncbi:MAG: GNAT family N-acetyltransferase [Actinomycetota bacterium]|nr:GNAT family N-acetyltransferase [Actinomycetota bacterium]